MKPWDKKRKRFDFFFDFERIEEMMDALMRDFMEEPSFREMPRKKPLTMGFSFRFDQSGRPVMQRFGNIKVTPEKKLAVQAREPLVDINKTDKEIIVTAELPGVEEKDLDLKVEKNKLIIKARPDKFYKEIALEENIDTKKFKTSFKNGVLEVVLKPKKGLLKRLKRN